MEYFILELHESIFIVCDNYVLFRNLHISTNYLASCLEFYSRGLLLSGVAIFYHCHSKTEKKYIYYSFEFIYNFIHGTWTIHISEEYSTRTSKLDRSCWNCASFVWIDDNISTRIILDLLS